MPENVTVPGRIVSLEDDVQVAGQLVPSYFPEQVMLELIGMSAHRLPSNGEGSVTA
jgi:hypothetical protein